MTGVPTLVAGLLSCPQRSSSERHNQFSFAKDHSSISAFLPPSPTTGSSSSKQCLTAKPKGCCLPAPRPAELCVILWPFGKEEPSVAAGPGAPGSRTHQKWLHSLLYPSILQFYQPYEHFFFPSKTKLHGMQHAVRFLSLGVDIPPQHWDGSALPQGRSWALQRSAQRCVSQRSSGASEQRRLWAHPALETAVRFYAVHL